MWIFGYGSLIFRPAFTFVERRTAWVAGYTRRFWQGSPDHRGTPEVPGRVVTLVPDEAALCGGCAYRVSEHEAETIYAALDEREQAGFVRKTLPLLDAPAGSAFAEGITWIATVENAHFLGPLDERAIAEHVKHAHGPSGPNADYVLALASALRTLGIEDLHVEAIARHLGAATG